MLIAFHKPFGVITQFSPTEPGTRSLAGFGFPKNVYPLGRLDLDSEGLLLLSDERQLNERLLEPSRKHDRTYWAQVERMPKVDDLRTLERGITIQGRRTLPCRVWILNPQPVIAERTPPIRFRKTVETCWIGLLLVEGKNRQVRRMTAAIGHPTLRLIRVAIGQFELGDLAPGTWKVLSADERERVFTKKS
jgi:23S rRNA pseudouridine2457 synthase